MPEYKQYIRCHIVKATPMTRGCYNKLRGWEMPANENLDDEGYHIIYPDGYESWCPKAQFEAAGNPIDNITFGQAIDACRYCGKRIHRKGWNGVDQYIEYRECAVLFPDDGSGEIKHESTSHAFVFHGKNIRTGETNEQVGWLASQADMAANDWVIVD